MPKCMPISTNQHNPTKIIDGCQVITEILADTKNSCSQKCSYAIWLKLRKSKWDSQHCATLCQGNLHKVAAHYFLLFMYIFKLYKEDWTILYMLGVGP